MMLESTGPKMEPCGTPPVTGDSLMLFRSKGFPVPQQGGHSKMWDISVWRPHPSCTGISFEVESTTLLSPPGDRKVFGWRGTHTLWSRKHIWSCSPPVQAVPSSQCFPSHPHLSQSLRWRAALANPILHLPLHYCYCGDGASTLNPFMQVLLIWLGRKKMQKKCISIFRDFFFKCVFALIL